MERKLAAIFSADVKGYSRLMGDDEIATVRTLTAYREVMTALIHAHRGRVVDSPGDNLLAEFPSVVAAVQGATEIQRELTVRNAKLPPQRQMAFRIGINVGDVLTEDGRLYGDGVNIAARLEGLAAAGGICISEAAYTQVKNKLALGYEYIGEQQVKNIAEPVRAYQVQLEPSAATPATSQGLAAHHLAEEPLPSRYWRRAALTAIVLLCVGAGGLVLRQVYTPPSSPPTTEPVQEASSLPLPDKPSLVVLPFVNMSNDPEQEYFSDGITEDLTSTLSRLSHLFVISRNTAFFYKGKTVKMPELSKELGVQYVLEGSVRKADGKMRITTQLIDATQDRHLWSERYDRPFKDIFAVQDEIMQQIVANLRVEVMAAELARVRRVPTENLTAYDFYLRGLEAGVHVVTEAKQEANAQARQMYEKAVELDPTYAEAYAMLGFTYYSEFFNRWTADPAQTLERAFTLAQQAVALDDSLPTPHFVLGFAFLWKKQHEQALAEVKTAMALDPNNPTTHLALGIILAFAGQPQDGAEFVEKALRLNPRYPAYYLQNLGRAYRLAGRCEEAIAPLKRAVALSPTFIPPRVNLVVCYIELGREEEARAEATEVLRLNPNYSLEEAWRHNQPFKDPAVLEHFFAAARKAGLK